MATPPVPPRPVSVSGKPPVPPLPPNYIPDPPSDVVSPRPQRINPSIPADMARNLEHQLGAPPSFPNAIPLPPGPGTRPLSWAGGPAYAEPYRQGPSPGPASAYPSFGGAMHPPAPPYQPQQPWSQPPSALSPPSSLPPWQAPQQPAAPGWNSGYDASSPWLMQRGPSPAPPAAWPPMQQQPVMSPPPPSLPPPAWNQPSLPSPVSSQSNYSATSLSQSMANLSFSTPGPQSPVDRNTMPPLPDPHSRTPPRRQSPPQDTSGQPPEVVIKLPTVESLASSSQSVLASSEPSRKIAWTKQVLQLVDLTQAASDRTDGQISDPDLVRLAETAIQHISNISALAGSASGSQPLFVAEAVYLRGTLLSSGSFPAYFPRDARSAFKDFEQAARLGFYKAWFKLGRDYESVNDLQRAKDCFERGAQYEETSCLYRLGMANLLGQLGIQKNPAAAIPLLRQAADLVDVDVPQPAYVYGMLMLGEFEQVDVPMQILMSTLPPASPDNRDPRQNEARRRIERAAYFNFAPAQYKLGLAYENAQMGCPFDPLLSVQYYSLASKQGETEADMALSKWFLCGHPGSFDKDEVLAVTFAEKAAKKGLPSAEFAMGYYCEVGVGGPKDIAAARKWYQLAAQHKNPDANDRLKALSQPTPAALSRTEHEKLTDNTLIRKRTVAKEFSMASGRGTGERRAGGQELSDVRRMADEAKKTLSQTPASRSPKQNPRPLHDEYPRSNSQPLPPGNPPAGRGGRFQGQARGPERGSSPSRGQQPLPSRDRSPPPNDRNGPSGRPPMPAHGRGHSLSDNAVPQRGGRGDSLPARGGGRGAGGRNISGPTSNQAKKGPATFAEMGFQSQPTKSDNDCVIM